MTKAAPSPVSRHPNSNSRAVAHVVPYLPILGAFLAGIGDLGWIAALAFAALAALRLALHRPDIWPQGAAGWRDSGTLSRVAPRLCAEAMLVFFAVAIGRGIATVAGIVSIVPLIVGAICLILALLAGREVRAASDKTESKATQPA